MSNEIEQPLRVGGIPSIVIPVSLYERMAACYYGGGPNHWEAKGLPTPKPKERTFEETVGASDRMEKAFNPEPEITEDEGRRLDDARRQALRELQARIPSGSTPMGAAASDWIKQMSPASRTPTTAVTKE